MNIEIETLDGVYPAGNDRALVANAVDHPWLSILVPVYNVQPYVEECLLSILDQLNRPGIELIVLDDNSTDASAALCRHVAAAHTGNIRILHHDDNRGLSAARNTMLEAAKGDYVWFLDSDDTMLPGAIDALYEIALTHCPDVILCDYIREGGKKFPTFSGPSNSLINCTDTLIGGVFSKRRMHAWSRVWKRELFGASIRFPEGACFEDVATIPWLKLKATTFYHVAHPWVYYRSRPGSIMARLSKSRDFDRGRNNDLAGALDGFHDDFARAVPHASKATSAAIGRFLAREFVKIAKRRLRSFSRSDWRAAREDIGRYLATMEASSPLPFSAIASAYLRERKLGRALALRLALAAAVPAPI
ncbi:MAG: glycosyltransferase family 2 protein [Sphingomonadaceae bacterium]|nr:glycosyltransferase family 2 protein [Sphingomonadaceae bacterium]